MFCPFFFEIFFQVSSSAQRRDAVLSRFDALSSRENWSWGDVEAADDVQSLLENLDLNFQTPVKPVRKPSKPSKPARTSTKIIKLSKHSCSVPQLEGRSFVRSREAQVEQLLKEFHATVLEQMAPVKVTWSKRLNKTAGITKCVRVGLNRSATIELATKVVDNTQKLRCTLAHELCHGERGCLLKTNFDFYRYFLFFK
jgi:hypothetical protein